MLEQTVAAAALWTRIVVTIIITTVVVVTHPLRRFRVIFFSRPPLTRFVVARARGRRKPIGLPRWRIRICVIPVVLNRGDMDPM